MLKITKNSHWLYSEILNQKPKLIKALFSNLIINTLQIFISLFTMAVYNKIIPNNAISSLVSLAVGVSMLIVFDLLFKLLKARLLLSASDDIEAALQPKLFSKVISWDLAKRPKFSGSSAMLIRDLESVIELFANSSLATLIGLPFVIVNLAVIGLVAGPVVYITLSICLLTLFISTFYYHYVVRLSEQSKKLLTDKSSVFLEAVSNLETLKSIGNYGYFQKKWNSIDFESREVSDKVKLTLSDVASANALVTSLGQVVLIAVGAYFVIVGDVTSGGLIAAVMLNGRTVQPISQLSNLLQKFSTARAGFVRLDAVFRAQSVEELRRKNIRLSRVDGPIHVNNLAFKPEGASAPILNINKLRVNPGEHIGVVGSVGSGKSTFLKCLAGVITPNEGSVSYDAFDTSAIHQADLRRSVAYLGQSPGIFSGTVRDNLLLGNDQVSEDVILEVIKVTGLDAVLKKLPNGLEFVLSEGGRELSGGQKQILALARALISQPSTVLLDEPTSAMDPKHEQLFIKQMREFVSGRTMVVVTHRKPILALTERIIVIEAGRVVLDGGRDEVLARFK